MMSAAERLGGQIATLLEQLVGAKDLVDLRQAIARQALAAGVRGDLPVLERLRRAVQVLIDSQRRKTTPVNESSARRFTGRNWRRPQAPIRFPRGDPPTGWETRLHETITSPDMCDSSHESRARLTAYWRGMAEGDSGE